MVRNKHKVQKKQWQKWSDRGRLTFNRMFDLVLNQGLYNGHPNSTILPRECWRTVAWNVAWEAACCASTIGDYKSVVIDSSDYKAPTKRAA